MKVDDEILKALPYWKNLTETEKELVRRSSTIQKYEAGASLFTCGGSCLGMIYVIKGSLRVYFLSEEGREITLFYIKKGDPCVMSASCVMREIKFETNMTVESDCELLVVNSEAFGRLTEENIHVKCFMYELAASRFSTVVWVFQQIVFFGFDRRLANFLVEEYEKTGSAEIKMTHEQIAVTVNSAREVVARMLRRFEGDGAVKLKRGATVITDIEKLKKMI